MDKEMAKEVKKMNDEQMRTCITEAIMRISSEVDIAEIYSPPRITKEALRYGMKAGLAMDLTTGWDFTRSEHKEAAREYRRRVRPKLLIGSPMCQMFSTLQNLSKKSWSDER